MRINHNSLALNASNHFAKINENISKSMARLSSGNKITSPADDAAGLAISTKMDAQIRGLNRAALNSTDGVSVIQSTEGGLEEMTSILGRMRELAVQASNDVNSEDDRDAIQEEINNIKDEIDQISRNTAFNGQKLLNGDMSRRSLSSDTAVKATYISEEVKEGVYELSVSAAATKAEYSIGLANSAAKVTKEQAGSLTINGFLVEIKEDMTMTEVFQELQTHLTKIGIDVIALNGSDVGKFENGDPVIFRTKGYGQNEKIEIDCDNNELAALIGVIDGDVVRGTDTEITISNTPDGFRESATYKADGEDVTIVDRNGFEMKFTMSAEKVEAAGGSISDITVEVLSAGTMVIQTGSNEGEQLSIDIPKLDSKSLGIDELIMYTHGHASQAIDAIDNAVKMVANIRSKLGAYENRLDDVHDSLEVQEESMTEAYSRIMDTDMAEEMTNYTQQDVLAQAAISMMQKSNERPESVLQLLQ